MFASQILPSGAPGEHPTPPPVSRIAPEFRDPGDGAACFPDLPEPEADPAELGTVPGAVLYADLAGRPFRVLELGLAAEGGAQ